MKKLAIASAVAAGISLLFVSSAFAAYSLFGNASIVSPGNASPNAVKLPSTCPTGYPSCLSDGSFTFAGISYTVPGGTTFNQLDVLSSDFRVEADDQCVGGAPRFQIGIDTDGDGDRDGNIFAYFGPDSGGAPCVGGPLWQNTGDFLEGTRFLDTTQLPGGAYQDPYALALTKYGNLRVTGIQLVLDGSWHPTNLDREQTVFIDNTNVDTTVYTYDQPQDRDQCKDGGWRNLTRSDGSTFKNQGDCVSYFNTGR